MQATDIAKLVDKNPDLATQMREDPSATLKAMGAIPLQTDVWIYRSVVVTLGIVIILTVVGATVLSFYERTVPEGVFVLAGTCAGAMAFLITQGRK